MQRLDGLFVYSASDLNDYLECRRLTELESLVARGRLARPDIEDPQADLLRRKGAEHERAYLEKMLALYPGDVAAFTPTPSGIEAYLQAEATTLEAMKRGAPIIYQATFFDGRFVGYADFLRRVDEPSTLGAYSYEVIDTKLGLSPKPYYVIQICNYSEHVARLQGTTPHFGYVVLGNGDEEAFRLHDYMAYYRRLKHRFLEFASNAERGEDAAQYPFECGHCTICPFDAACELLRRDDDHLSLVAWVRRDQIAKLEAARITTVRSLAGASSAERPTGMNAETFGKLRRQADLQIRARDEQRPIYELLQHAPPMGFTLLPRPAEGDVFFDMEGDPLYEPGRGLEYLFGCWMPDDEASFRAFWGTDRDGERRAFEQFVDFVTERRERYPAMHIYHYASYEKNALRKLAQLHATREKEVDDLLRGEVLVDLFTVVRQALAISEERYGLKNLERFYDLTRETDVKKGDESIVMFERWLFEPDSRILRDIERYNRDDCLSTYRLRTWLLERRAEAIASYSIDLPHRDEKAEPEPETDADAQFRSDVERRLLDGIQAPQSELEYRAMPAQRRMRYLLGNLVAYHTREEKPEWWAYFDRCDNIDRLTEFDRDSIGGLKLCEEVPPYRLNGSTVYTYTFPDQLYKLAEGDAAVNPRTRKQGGTIVRLAPDEFRLELKMRAGLETAREVFELIPGRPFVATEQRKALARAGAELLGTTLAREHPATNDVLSNRAPRFLRPTVKVQPDDLTAESVSAAVRALDSSYLFIQGPPGSGKTTICSKVICDLLAAGKRVAVSSTSHKAIHNLLQKVETCTFERGGAFRGLYKHSKSNPGSVYHSPSLVATPFIESVDDRAAFSSDDYQLAGGTGWLCAREELDGKFDYLFIDEAGQVSLADAIAMSLCAKNVVLLGDPSQLAQVSQGRHPLHADDSVLQHLLGGDQTVSPSRGIFLERSYRMQPRICEFVSNAMYDGRLKPGESTGQHCILTDSRQYSGLYFVGVEHAGNSSSAREEADEIARRISVLLAEGRLVDSEPGLPEIRRKINERDCIVVTPYNAQRRLILEVLREADIDVDVRTGVRVGTVDKFQGQEAAVVFYSMATSSGEDIPRNVEFLFERNRFNVAISRARAASVLVCSPRLLDIRCRTPEQMALANLLCAFEESAESLATANVAVAP